MYNKPYNTYKSICLTILPEIIKKIESEEGLPKGVLTDVYDEEKMQIHLDNRRNLTAPLRELIMKYYSKQNETKNN